ncbi:hypothetical protein PMAYCL1PPCAC_00546, partial [Pristionchus mayeri]
SEDPSTCCIFFKDKQNELKGPFTECQVQEGYRKKCFDASFPFCFLKKGEKPRDDTPFHTLAELTIHNGFGAPFSIPPDVIFNRTYDSPKERLIWLEKCCRNSLRMFIAVASKI